MGVLPSLRLSLLALATSTPLVKLRLLLLLFSFSPRLRLRLACENTVWEYSFSLPSIPAAGCLPASRPVPRFPVSQTQTGSTHPSIHPSLPSAAENTDFTLPLRPGALVLSPVFLSPPDAPPEHICSDLGRPLHPGGTSGTPCSRVEAGGTSGRPRSSRDSCSPGDGGDRGGSRTHPLGHFLPSWAGCSRKARTPVSTGARGAAAPPPFPMLGNLSHPFHPTPGQLPSFRLGVEVGEEGGLGKPRLGNG